MNPDQLGPVPEGSQPAPNRALASSQRRGQPAMTRTGDVGVQRPTDRLHVVTTPDQPAIGQADMGASTRPAPRPPWPQPLLLSIAPQRPPAGMTPRTQHPPTPRTSQTTRQQIGLDLNLIGPYHKHRCLRHLPEGPSRETCKFDGRVLARQRTDQPDTRYHRPTSPTNKPAPASPSRPSASATAQQILIEGVVQHQGGQLAPMCPGGRPGSASRSGRTQEPGEVSRARIALATGVATLRGESWGNPSPVTACSGSSTALAASKAPAG